VKLQPQNNVVIAAIDLETQKITSGMGGGGPGRKDVEPRTPPTCMSLMRLRGVFPWATSLCSHIGGNLSLSPTLTRGGGHRTCGEADGAVVRGQR
jgi:hypothetical protein